MPALTSACLRLEFPSGGGQVSLALRASGTASGRTWSVGLASAHKPEEGRVTAVVAAAKPDLSLAQLPVVGSRLPQNAARLSRVALAARNGAKVPSGAMIARLQSLLASLGCEALPALTAQALERKASVGVEAQVSGAPVQVWTGFGSGPRMDLTSTGEAGAEPLPGPEGSGSPALLPASEGEWWGSRALPVAHTAPDKADADPPEPGYDDTARTAEIVPVVGKLTSPELATGHESRAGAVAATVWKDVNRAVGPLQIHRFGLAYTTSPKRLWLLLDASLGAVGLVFDAVGLGLGVAFDGAFTVSGTLDGLGVSYAAGPVHIAGALVRDPNPPEPLVLLIGGMLVVTTPRLGLLAAGMYGEMSDGRATVFVVGQMTGLHLPLGPIDVTGLLGGLGYNSRLALPEKAAEVPQYPLVAGIGNESALPLKGGAAAVLKKLGSLVTAAGDHFWIAVGAQFTVFKVVEASVVVALRVSPGDLTVALLGVARARFPQKDDPYACLTLGLRAVYRLSTGELSVSGALDPAQSYLVSKDCRLSGEFAVCTWVPPSSRAGDFVITLGGYHPAYQPPRHYPRDVQRIGISWQPNDAVVVRGEAYAAVTPSMLQVGGALRIEYSSSRVSAWLRAHIDATVQWEPFRFELSVGVQVGVEIRFLGTHRLELDVKLVLWGPPTGGVAQLRLPVVPDVYVRFGAGRPKNAAALGWSEFHTRVLAGAGAEVLVASGLLQEQKTPSARNATPVVHLDSLTLAVRTPAPCTHLRTQTGADTHQTKAGSADATVPIRPMNKGAVTTACTLSLRDSSGRVVSLEGWTVTPDHAALPAAAWGAPLGPSSPPPVAPRQELLGGQVTGARLVPPPATRTDPPLQGMPKERLEAESGKDGKLPGADGEFGDRLTDGTRRKVAEAVSTTAAQQARTGLYACWRALGIAPGNPTGPPLDALNGYASRLWSTVADDPMLVPTSGGSR
ncbi:DUF6603 domain-containing protein [Streptomyces sp. NPDC037389]|uniref:DUF6603 domain-containing protein n=1 Tax=Streptomyces sp. NPDC037389 TaxID=3155369 RepID=UPI0033D1273F